MRRRSDFRRCYRGGRKLGGRWMVLHVLARPADADREAVLRAGFTVSRRVGKAVVRNRVKRRLRESLRQRAKDVRLDGDLVVAARPPAAGASYSELDEEMGRLLLRAARWNGVRRNGGAEGPE